MNYKALCICLTIAALPALATANTSQKEEKKIWKAKPLTEQAMQVVSGEVGGNVLNILGAPAAGLRSDVDNPYYVEEVETENYDEGQEAEPLAKTVMKALEEEVGLKIESDIESRIGMDEHLIDAMIEDGEKLERSTSAFSTSSDLVYKPHGHHHEATFLDDGTVVHERNLQIELLKFENLRGTNPDDGRSAGNLFLSDWASHGRTEILVQ